MWFKISYFDVWPKLNILQENEWKFELDTNHLNLSKGTFNNYVDQILPNFDPLTPSGGQTWTFYIKFGISEKHTKFEKIFLMVLTNQLIYLVKVKTMRKIFFELCVLLKKSSVNFDSNLTTAADKQSTLAKTEIIYP